MQCLCEKPDFWREESCVALDLLLSVHFSHQPFAAPRCVRIQGEVGPGIRYGMDYTPRHAQPVTLAQLRQLEPELLTGGESSLSPRGAHIQDRADSVQWTNAEIARLENSIQHLEASNVELRVWAGISSTGKPDDGTATTAAAAAVDDADEQLDEDSKREFAEAVRENEETMCVVGPVARFPANLRGAC